MMYPKDKTLASLLRIYQTSGPGGLKNNYSNFLFIEKRMLAARKAIENPAAKILMIVADIFILLPIIIFNTVVPQLFGDDILGEEFEPFKYIMIFYIVVMVLATAAVFFLTRNTESNRRKKREDYEGAAFALVAIEFLLTYGDVNATIQNIDPFVQEIMRQYDSIDFKTQRVIHILNAQPRNLNYVANGMQPSESYGFQNEAPQQAPVENKMTDAEYAEKFRALKAAYEAGVFTEEEYKAKANAILNGRNGTSSPAHQQRTYAAPEQARPQPSYYGAPQQARPQPAYYGAAPQNSTVSFGNNSSGGAAKKVIISLVALVVIVIGGYLGAGIATNAATDVFNILRTEQREGYNLIKDKLEATVSFLVGDAKIEYKSAHYYWVTKVDTKEYIEDGFVDHIYYKIETKFAGKYATDYFDYDIHGKSVKMDTSSNDRIERLYDTIRTDWKYITTKSGDLY